LEYDCFFSVHNVPEGIVETLSRMAVFAKVVDAGSFSAAAQELGVSKSAVSKQVAKLEDYLGARLLNRTTRRLSLTEVGQAFYERCTRIVAEAEEAELAVTRLSDAPRGVLRVTVPVSFGLGHVGPAIGDFMTQFPELTVEMTLTDRKVDLIEEGLDVAVRVGEMPDSSLIARKVASTRRIVCAAPGYWRKYGKPSHPGELKQHHCLLYAYNQPPDEWSFAGPRGRIAVRVRGRMKANNGEILRDAATAGVGVIFSPTFIVGDSVKRGVLEPALTDFEEAPMGIHAVYPHNRHLSAKVRAFVGFLAERFGGEPGWDR
jgi:DNA-binding transcriptional LysR family regulator